MSVWYMIVRSAVITALNYMSACPSSSRGDWRTCAWVATVDIDQKKIPIAHRISSENGNIAKFTEGIVMRNFKIRKSYFIKNNLGSEAWGRLRVCWCADHSTREDNTSSRRVAMSYGVTCWPANHLQTENHSVSKRGRILPTHQLMKEGTSLNASQTLVSTLVMKDGWGGWYLR